MFEFRKIELSDRSEIIQRLAVSDLRGCEYSFANNFAWQRLNESLICLHGDLYISMGLSGGKPYVLFPTGVKKDKEGKERFIELFAELEKYFAAHGDKLTVCSALEEDLPWLREVYGDRIEVSLSRDDSDYIYSSADLIGLAGKKYHGKRNHIKRFKENDWSYEPITEKTVEECVLFTAQSYNLAGDNQGSAAIEQYAIHQFLMNMDALGLKGGILRLDGEAVGITIGEQLNSDTFVVHIEKARGDINGAYPTLCNQFAAENAADFRYINREEDMGIEGLRKSKLSYHPEFLLDKYTIRFK